MLGLKFRPTETGNISLNAQTAVQAGTPISLHDCRQYAGTIKGVGTVTAGVVIFETAPTQDYDGVWSELYRRNFTTDTLTDSVDQNAVGPCGYGGFYRWRISTEVTGGGSITCSVNGLMG